MKNIDINLLEPYKHDLISFKTECLNNVINYYENSFLPELKHNHGYTQGEKLQRLAEEKENFLRDCKNGTPLKYLDFSKAEVLNCLRRKAIHHRRRADDFKNNPLIKIPNLKKAVTIANLLIKIEPKLEIYSLHWLTLDKAIQVH